MAADQLLDTAERRKFVLEQRGAGKTYRQIAAAAEQEFGADRLPKGWDERYAHKDLTRELKRVRTELEETAEEARALELQRLDAMLSGLWSDAAEGDADAVHAALRLMKRRAKYLGLDEPETFDVQTSTDALITVLLDALQEHPEARQKAAEAIAQIDE